MVTFDIELVQVLGLVAGVILPVLVGLVTTRTTHSGVKAALLAGLAVLTNILTELVEALNTGSPYDLGSALLLGLGTFVIAVATHYGLWKPTSVSEKAQAVGSKE